MIKKLLRKLSYKLTRGNSVKLIKMLRNKMSRDNRSKKKILRIYLILKEKITHQKMLKMKLKTNRNHEYFDMFYNDLWL